MRKLAASSTKLNCCYNPRTSLAEFAYTDRDRDSNSYTYFDTETFTDAKSCANAQGSSYSAAAPIGFCRSSQSLANRFETSATLRKIKATVANTCRTTPCGKFIR